MDVPIRGHDLGDDGCNGIVRGICFKYNQIVWVKMDKDGSLQNAALSASKASWCFTSQTKGVSFLVNRVSGRMISENMTMNL